MNKDLRINFSAVILCYNEAHHLPRCLASLDFCREIILVDMGSTDGSVEIAQEFGARILYHPRLPFANKQRQYGLTQAQNEWVFILDPDEEFPKEELKTVERAILAHPDYAAFRVPIQYYFRGRKLTCTMWGRPGMTRWTVVHRDRIKATPWLHQEFCLDQKIYYFSWEDMKPIKHYWIDSYRELFRQEKRYLRHEGESLYQAGARFCWSGLLRATALALKVNLVNYRGLSGGLDCLFLSLFRAGYTVFSWLSLRRYEKQRP